MKTQHTPGPWYIAHHTDIDGDKSIDIRHCCDNPPSTPEIHQIARLPENELANASLIASSPGDRDSLLTKIQKAHDRHDYWQNRRQNAYTERELNYSRVMELRAWNSLCKLMTKTK